MAYKEDPEKQLGITSGGAFVAVVWSMCVVHATMAITLDCYYGSIFLASFYAVGLLATLVHGTALQQFAMIGSAPSDQWTDTLEVLSIMILSYVTVPLFLFPLLVFDEAYVRTYFKLWRRGY